MLSCIVSRQIQQGRWRQHNCGLHRPTCSKSSHREQGSGRSGHSTVMGRLLGPLETWGWESHGSLLAGNKHYVLCSNNFVLRISLSKDEYQVIKMPAGAWIEMIGKSEKGLYAAGYSTDRCLKVWILNESSSHEHEWVLRHNKLLRPLVSARCCLDKPVCGPWVLEDIYFYAAHSSDPYSYQDVEECRQDKAAEVAASREKFSNWTSDDDDDFFLDAEDSYEGSSHIDRLLVLGFHPFKEIIFLEDVSSGIAVAYGLNSSKFQYLGNVCPTPPLYFEGHGHGEFIERSFVYTPCKLDAP
ncbi:hypothetical protein BS78_01G206900 [Paspalum vaginatum]|nr:hypothetical protein BS78_01G206900 [Paspalum vaginatum]